MTTLSVNFFLTFFPEEYLRDVMLPATTFFTFQIFNQRTIEILIFNFEDMPFGACCLVLTAVCVNFLYILVETLFLDGLLLRVR